MKKEEVEILAVIVGIVLVLLRVFMGIGLCYVFAWIVLYMFPNIGYNIYQITFVTYIASLILKKVKHNAKY